jgi:hypothetical protein
MRTLPRLGALVVNSAIPRPVNVYLALAPLAFAYRAEPPENFEDEARLHVPR